MASGFTECVEALQEYEVKLRDGLRAVGAPPFIGLLDVVADDRARMRKLVSGALSGSRGLLPPLFVRTPLVATWSISSALAEGYGEQGDAAVYRVIECVLGISLPAAGSSRRDLHNRFADVCNNFGLAIGRGVHQGRLVDAYLAQAGVSRPQLHHVVEAFLKGLRSFGPPPTHSTALLNDWEDDCLDFLPPGVRVPGRILETDDTGFHAAVFARCRNQDIRDTDFESKFQQIYQDLQGNRKGHRARRRSIPAPKITWFEDRLSLALPQVEGRVRLGFDGQIRWVRGGIGWPIPQPWPTWIEWSAGDATGTVPILAAGLVVMAFDAESGRCVAEIGNRSTDCEVDATLAVLVARSTFQVDGIEALSTSSSAFVRAVSLSATPIELVAGGRTYRLQKRPRPRVMVETGKMATGQNGDLLSRGAVISVDNGLGVGQKRAVKVVAGSRVRVFTLKLDDAGCGRFPLTEFFGAGGDLERVRVGLLPEATGSESSDQRSVAEVTAWVWPILQDIDDGVLLGTLGLANGVVWDRCRHLVRDPEGPIRLDPKGGYRHARITFDTDEGRLGFDIPWTGVLIVQTTAEGETHTIPIGTRLVITEADLDSSVRISSPDPRAVLNVRGRIETSPFIFGSRVLALRDLAEPASDDEVCLVNPNGSSQVLLHILHATTPESFDTRREGGCLMVRVRLPHPIDAIRLAIESETGSSETVDVAVASHPVDSATPDWLKADTDGDELRSVNLQINLSQFEDGMVLALIDARPLEGDRFRPLRANNGTVYALALAAHSSEIMHQTEEVPDIHKRFLTISRWLAMRLAEDSWRQVAQTLPQRWEQLGGALESAPAGIRTLIESSYVEDLGDASSDWIPNHHPLMVDPKLYQAPAAEFQALNESEEPGARELSLVADLQPAEMPDRKEFGLAALMGFENAHVASIRGVPLEGFSIKRYVGALVQCDVDPSAGLYWRGEDLLNPGHWRAAHEKLRDRLEELDPSDSERRSRRFRDLMRLIRPDRRTNSSEFPLPEQDHDDGPPTNQRERWCSTFLHRFSIASRRGAVSDFLTELERNQGRPETALLRDIGFLVRLGPELFAYHMLLSELEVAHGK